MTNLAIELHKCASTMSRLTQVKLQLLTPLYSTVKRLKRNRTYTTLSVLHLFVTLRTIRSLTFMYRSFDRPYKRLKGKSIKTSLSIKFFFFFDTVQNVYISHNDTVVINHRNSYLLPRGLDATIVIREMAIRWLIWIIVP